MATTDWQRWLTKLNPDSPVELYILMQSVIHEEDFGGTWSTTRAGDTLRISGAFAADTLALKLEQKQAFLDELAKRSYCCQDIECWYHYEVNIRNPKA